MGILCLFLCVACYYDYRYSRIPNGLAVVMLLTAPGYSFVVYGWPAVCRSCIQMVLVGLALYLVFKIGALGAGDVKLFAVSAGFFPADKVIYFLFYAMLAAGLVSLLRMLSEQNLWERLYYLGAYVTDVVKKGKWQLYRANLTADGAGIQMAGPILCGVLLYMGGVY